MPEWSILGMAPEVKRAHSRPMRRDRSGLLGLLALALVLAPVQPAAASVPMPPVPAVQCPTGMLCRTVIDRAAWDEQVTVTLRDAWDEEVTLTLEPERTATRSVQVRPPDLVHYTREKSPARTVTHSYLIEAGHNETRQQWVSSGYWQDYYVDTSRYVYVSGYWAYSPGYWATSPGYWAWSSGYWAWSSGYWAWSPGYWAYSGGYLSWSCNGWWCWPSWVSGYSYWVSGYSYWVSGYSYWVSGYSYWVPGSSYWVSGYSYWVPGYSYWQSSGYWSTRYVDTSHYENRQVWVPDLWGTWTEYVPAVYEEWYELVPAIMGTETYTLPAVTTIEVVNHAAVTDTQVQHHDAVTREIATDPASLTTQSRQSAAARNVPATTSTTTRLRAPVSIPLVAGATVSADATNAWLAPTEHDSWWSDRTADGWSTSGRTASYSSISSRAVSDAPSRGDAYLTSGGPGSSSANGGLFDALLLLIGLVTSTAVGHQLARSAASSSASGQAYWSNGSGSITSDAPSGRTLTAGNAVGTTKALGSFYAPADRGLRNKLDELDLGGGGGGGGPGLPTPEPQYGAGASRSGAQGLWAIPTGQPRIMLSPAGPIAGMLHPTVIGPQIEAGPIEGSYESPQERWLRQQEEAARQRWLRGQEELLGGKAPVEGSYEDPFLRKLREEQERAKRQYLRELDHKLVEPWERMPEGDHHSLISKAGSPGGSQESPGRAGVGRVAPPRTGSDGPVVPEGGSDGEGAETGIPVYRAYGTDDEGEGSGPYGPSWTPDDPRAMENPRRDMGLPDANHGRFVIAGTLIDNEGVRVKLADPYPPDADNGGKPEYLVPDPRRQIQIDGVFGVNPEW